MSVRKQLLEGRLLDREQLADELDDVLWRVATVSSLTGSPMGAIADNNIRKLVERYPLEGRVATMPRPVMDVSS